MLVDSHLGKAEQQVDRADRREQNEHKQAKDDEVKKFEAYFSDKHTREAKADARQRESLRERMDSLLDHRFGALANDSAQREPKKFDAKDEIGEYSLKDTSASVTGVQGQSVPVPQENTELPDSEKEIHAVVRKILREQEVFSNMAVKVSVNDENAIDVLLLQQKGKMVVCLSSGFQELNQLLSNSKDILEQELKSSFQKQEFEIIVV